MGRVPYIPTHRSHISHLSPGGKRLKKISRLLIAHDESDCSDAMLQDLRRAGLPAAVEVAVATIAYGFVPPGSEIFGQIPLDKS